VRPAKSLQTKRGADPSHLCCSPALLLLQRPTRTACTASQARTAPMQARLGATQELTRAWTRTATPSCLMLGPLEFRAWPSCLSVSLCNYCTMVCSTCVRMCCSSGVVLSAAPHCCKLSG
jgi:hypothetical protein